MAESLEASEARIAESQVELGRAQAEWERRVRDGDDDPENLLFVAGEIVTVKKEIRDLLADLASLAEDIARLAERDERAAAEKRQRVENAKRWTFTDEEVLATLTRALADCDDLGATGAQTVAYQLAGEENTQSDRIRAGLALSRLAAEGKVVKLVAGDGRTPHVWSLPGLTVSDWILKTHHVEKRGDN